jgi:tape measure domain-containing protein
VGVVVDVTIDPSGADKGADQVEERLEGIAGKGRQVGKSLGDALAFGGKTREVIAQLDALDASIAREARALERIKGPARDYDQELETVNDLHERGKITTAEWANEVAKLNKQLAAAIPTLTEWDRKASDAAKAASMISVSKPGHGGGEHGGGGEHESFTGGLGKSFMGGAAEALTIGGAGALVAEGLKESINHWSEVREEEIQAGNALSKYYDTTKVTTEAIREQVMSQASLADKFETAGASARALNAAVEQQDELAESLHVKLGVAVAAYDAVRQATSDLYLTTQQQIDATRNLGRIMEMNNQPTSNAAEVMGRLQYSLQIGTMSSLDFQSIAKQYPDILKLWTDSTGKSAKELRQMAQDGKINTSVMRTFVDAIVRGDGVSANYAKRTLTVAQAMKDTGKNAYDAMIYVGDFNAKLEEEGEAFVTLDEQARRIALSYQKWTDDVKKANEEVAKGQALAALGFGLAANDRAGRDIKMVDEVVKTLKQAKQDLGDFQSQMKQGIVPRNQQSQIKLESLLGAVDPAGLASYKRILGDTLEPQRTFTRDMGTLNSFLHDGAISVSVYRQEVDKLFQAFAGADFAKLLDFQSKSRGALGDYSGQPSDQYSPSTFSPGDKNGEGAQFGTDYLEPRYKPSLPLDRVLNGNAETFATIGRPEDVSTNAEYIRQWEEMVQLKTELFEKSNKSEGSDLNADLARMEEQLKRNAEATKKWRDELAATHQQNKFIGEQIEMIGKDLGQYLVTAARTADMSWSKFLKGLEDQLGNLLDKIADAITQAAILYALTGSISGGMGAGVGGGYGGLLGWLSGGAHANGGEYTVPGYGPADSKRVLFDLTPGEQVLFVPPGAYRPTPSQLAANNAGGYGGMPSAWNGGAPNVNLRVVNQEHNPRGVLHELNSPEGEQVLLNFMQRNRGTARAILGIKGS